MSGNLRLNGGTSGYSELRAPDDAGDQVFIFPLTGGTLMTTNDIVSPDGLWTRNGTTISPSNPGDNLDDIGSITAADDIKTTNGKLNAYIPTSTSTRTLLSLQSDVDTVKSIKMSVSSAGSITAAGDVKIGGTEADPNIRLLQAGGSVFASNLNVGSPSAASDGEGVILYPSGQVYAQILESTPSKGSTTIFRGKYGTTETFTVKGDGSITAASTIRSINESNQVYLAPSGIAGGSTSADTFTINSSDGSINAAGSIFAGDNADWAGDVKIAARTAGSNWGLTTAHDSSQANPNGLLCATGSATPSGASIRVEFDHPGLGGSGNKQAFTVDWDGGFASSQGQFSVNTAGIIHNPAGYGYTVGNGPRAVQIDDNGRMGGLTSVRASKKNIQYDYDSSWVQDLKPTTFNYRIKDEAGAYSSSAYDRTEYGLIAEDVEQVNPLICNYDFDDKLVGVEYARLITPLVAELQKAVTRIEELEAKVAALES